jgi:hypothetical protein
VCVLISALVLQQTTKQVFVDLPEPLLYIICTMQFVISWSNQCTIIINTVFFATHTYVLATKLPPEDGNLVAETYVWVAKYTLLMIIVHWFDQLT